MTVLSVPTVVDEADAVGVELVLVVDAHEELQEVDRLGRRVLADRDAVAATDAVGGGAGAAGDAGKGNQPRSSPRPFLSALWSFWTDGAHWPISSMAALPLPTAAASSLYVAPL